MQSCSEVIQRTTLLQCPEFTVCSDHMTSRYFVVTPAVCVAAVITDAASLWGVAVLTSDDAIRTFFITVSMTNYLKKKEKKVFSLVRFFFGLKSGDREGHDQWTSNEHKDSKRKVWKVLPPEMKTIRARQDHRDGEWRSKLCCRAGLRSFVSVFLL